MRLNGPFVPDGSFHRDPVAVRLAKLANSYVTSGLGLKQVYVTYILQSEKDDRYYIGSTSNLEERLNRHSKGYSRYTKGKGPFKLVHKEIYNTLSEARKREHYLKSLKSKKAIKKLIFGPFV